jgi:hypothetical protein
MVPLPLQLEQYAKYPPLKVYVSRRTDHGFPWIRYPNMNSNKMVRNSHPKPFAKYTLDVDLPIHGSVKYAAARISIDSSTSLSTAPETLPNTGIKMASRSVPFAIAITSMPNQITNALAAIPSTKIISCSTQFVSGGSLAKYKHDFYIYLDILVIFTALYKVRVLKRAIDI